MKYLLFHIVCNLGIWKGIGDTFGSGSLTKVPLLQVSMWRIHFLTHSCGCWWPSVTHRKLNWDLSSSWDVKYNCLLGSGHIFVYIQRLTTWLHQNNQMREERLPAREKEYVQPTWQSQLSSYQKWKSINFHTLFIRIKSLGTIHI